MDEKGCEEEKSRNMVKILEKTEIHIELKKENKPVFEFLRSIKSIINFSKNNKTFLIYFTNNFWQYTLNYFKEPKQDNILICSTLREIFIAYLLDPVVREAIKNKHFQVLINSQLYPAVKQVKSETIKNMPVLEYIPYYVTTNSINCERFYA